MQINREDVVQAALMVERWCKEHEDEYGKCDCPFSTPLQMSETNPAIQWGKCIFTRGVASVWGLETFLRTRGLKHD